jgi:hypothetical protein
MARTKETKMFPEQQEKMTQEVMASFHPSTYGKDYAQKHSSFFEEVENSDLEVGINIKRSDFVMIFEPFTTTSDKLKILDVSDKFFDIVSVTIKSEPIVKRHFSPL